MGKFEDQLLDDLMREHGPELLAAERAERRSKRPTRVAVGVAALVGGVAAAFLLVPTENPAAPQQPLAAPPAQPQEAVKQADKPTYAVIENADGTVTIAVENASAIDALNKELADKNIPTTGVRCVQVSSVTVPPAEGKLVTIEELLQKIKSTRIKVTSSADGTITLYAAKCN
ncbi:hypothetical protein DMH04_28400 [Kibdelosporangium aridum]|uniref:Uncharacterized protein n=1 Tax=Kibdelosporangium aridum TaxID=2030 RepID=A0A428Z4J4_KIBAR|nr:hypothetical protein [Kibdelosporangium aridum]RSM81312.1 hypothetical protein DMH04_28400 [Kibdelosporangium aridum]